MSSTVAVTGATGYLGTRVCEMLEARDCGVVRLARDADGGFVDPTRPQQPVADRLRDVDAVVHLAARLVGPERRVTDYFADNVALTEQIAMESADAGVDRFVYASSRLVYPGDLARPLIEADARPDNPYGMSKLLGEQMVQYWSDRRAMTPVSLRISQIVGPGKGGRGVIGRLCDRLVADGVLRLDGDGRAVRDFVHLDDVARAVVLAVRRPEVPPVLNIGGGGVSLRQVMEMIADAAQVGDDSIVFGDAADDSQWSLDSELARVALEWAPRRTLGSFVAERLELARRTA